MKKNKSNTALIGTSGTYFVMAQLAAREFHASCTFGNAPFIDVLVSSQDGRRTASIQVKTARSAQVWRKKTLHHYEWYLGHKVAQIPKDALLFYAFVDLQLHYWEPGYKPTNITPEVFFIPLAEVAAWYQKYITKSDAMSRFWVAPDFLAPYKDAYGYELLRKAISS